MTEPPLLIVISGPTAVGKTNVSIQLAKSLNAEVISADSRQVYKEMSIGTAKPTLEERQGVPHHFIDHVSIHEEYSAGKYEREVLEFLDSYFQRKPVGILTGGTGFYIQAVLKGLDRFPRVSKLIKNELESDLKQKGLEFLQQELRSADPETYEAIDLQNPRRVLRALEAIRESGKKFSSFKQHAAERRRFQNLKILLKRDREELYQRIDRRVDQMLEDGLEREARNLYPFRELSSLQTVGYKEWFDHFDGAIDRKTCIEKIKQHTRNYAKRQLTWFRKKEGWHEFHADQERQVISFIMNHPKVRSIQAHSGEDDQ